MELSAELLESVLSSVRSDPARGAAENRKSPRVPLRCRVTITPVEGGSLGAPMHVWTRDISRGGVGLVCSKYVRTGTKFLVQLPRRFEKPVPILCIVRNCTELADDIFAVGATFTELRPSSNS